MSRIVLFALVALVIAGCGPPDDEDVSVQTEALTSADAAWWRGLTQAQRNQLLLDRAGRDLGRYVALDCKAWAMQVTHDASRGVASLPYTAPDAYGWYWQPGAYVVGQSTDIRNVQPGWIIQMRLRHADGTYGPHTAIVYLKTADGMWWLDSNWQYDDVVRMHYVSYAQFQSITFENGMNRYGLYQVIGGP